VLSFDVSGGEFTDADYVLNGENTTDVGFKANGNGVVLNWRDDGVVSVTNISSGKKIF